MLACVQAGFLEKAIDAAVLTMQSRAGTPWVLYLGARMLARKTGNHWYVLLNGLEVKVPPGSVDLIDSKAVQKVDERRSAREEEYQLAPSKG